MIDSVHGAPGLADPTHIAKRGRRGWHESGPRDRPLLVVGEAGRPDDHGLAPVRGFPRVLGRGRVEAEIDEDVCRGRGRGMVRGHGDTERSDTGELTDVRALDRAFHVVDGARQFQSFERVALETSGNGQTHPSCGNVGKDVSGRCVG